MSSSKARRPDLALTSRTRRHEFAKGDVVRLRTHTSPTQIRQGTATVVLRESSHPGHVVVDPLDAPPPSWDGLWIRRWQIKDLVLVHPAPAATPTPEETR